MQESLFQDTAASIMNSSSPQFSQFFYMNVSRNAFCEGTPQYLCFEAYRQMIDVYWATWDNKTREAVEDALEEVGPAGFIAIIAIVFSLIVCCALYAITHSRKMRAQIERLEAELVQMRERTKKSDEDDRVPLQLAPDQDQENHV